jgi:cytochrome c nitrite reductase small subunit
MAWSRRRWGISFAALLGMTAGLGLFTFGYARGYSYLTNDPAACANCHIMREHHDAWMKGSHHAVATCNDCHTPHTLVRKYLVKARNGFWHSFYFTVGGYPDPLRITPPNHEVTEHACRYCHAEITDAIDHPAQLSSPSAPTGPYVAARYDEPEQISCVRCHRYVGHWVR